ncbi:MAG: FAD-dependent oxidoreductase, partial [Flavobacteriales bacterium]|nr:FAD-dependent oxidoreductase [Flavobacteriales bacterium]
KKIVIIGGGLAGLASGIELLEQDSELDVTIYNMGHHIGGRATSWKNDEGYDINHGFHAIFKGYYKMKKLLRSSGTSLSKISKPNRKGYFFEPSTGKVHQFGKTSDIKSLRLRYRNGYNIFNNLRYISFFLKNQHTIMRSDDIEQFDDLCFTKWALENGADEELIKLRTFRMSQDALFNWPSEISAYIAMKSFRLIGNGLVYHIDGYYGEKIIQPIVEYFERLGGKIQPYRKLQKISFNDDKVQNLTFYQPDPTPHAFGTIPWKDKVGVLDETAENIKDFDAVVLAIPIDNFKELIASHVELKDDYSNLENLQTVATLNWQIWLEKKAMPRLKTAMNGLEEPMGSVIDHKPIISKYKRNKNLGSVLEFVGQESTFEELSDDQIKELVMDNFAKIPGCRDIRECGIIFDKFTRNKSYHERYLLTDPGTLKFRPKSQTNFQNFFLAGDWIRNEIDVPTMEGAICSGQTAANLVIKSLKK